MPVKNLLKESEFGCRQWGPVGQVEIRSVPISCEDIVAVEASESFLRGFQLLAFE